MPYLDFSVHACCNKHMCTTQDTESHRGTTSLSTEWSTALKENVCPCVCSWWMESVFSCLSLFPLSMSVLCITVQVMSQCPIRPLIARNWKLEQP